MAITSEMGPSDILKPISIDLEFGSQIRENSGPALRYVDAILVPKCAYKSSKQSLI